MNLAMKNMARALAFAALLAGFSGTGAANAQTVIRVGYPPVLTALPLFTALDKGFFKEEGLDVQVKGLGGGVAIEALAGGTIDLAGVNLVTLFQSRERGFDFVVASGDAGIGTKLPFLTMIMARKDSGISGVKDFEGKRFGISGMNNIDWLYNMEYLSRQGVDTSKISWVEIGVPKAPSALLNNQVDVAQLIDPFATIVQDTGEVKVLYSHYIEIAPGGLLSTWAAKGDWAKANTSALAGFVGALRRAADYNEKNQQEARERLIHYTKLDPAVAAKVPWPVWKLRVDPKDLALPMELSVKHGLLKAPLRIDDLLLPMATAP